MATSQLIGVNYEVDGDTINFFGAKGTKFGEGLWGINAFGGDAWEPVASSSIMDRVQNCITEDFKNGNGDKIAQLQLGARQAVVLFLEGVLTREHIKHAVENVEVDVVEVTPEDLFEENKTVEVTPDETDEFIDIPEVVIGDRTLTVRVLAKPKYNVATADSEGNVL